MSAGVWNLGFGIIAIVLGLTGQFALIGTHSSTALVAVGGVLVALGVYQLWKNKGR